MFAGRREVAVPLVKSAVRVLAVLEHFATTHAPATVAELSRRLKFPQSSTSKLLSSLERLGYLQHDAVARSYRPTLRVLLLGAWLHDEIFGEGSLVSAMDELRRRTGLTVLIGMRHGAQVRVILALRGLSPDAVPLPTGTLAPLTNSAMGHVLLTEESDAALGRILRRANAEETDRARRLALPELLRQVDATRRRGWASRPAVALPGRGVVAMKLPRLPGQPEMAIGIGASLERLESEAGALAQMLREATTALPSIAVRRQPRAALRDGQPGRGGRSRAR